MEYNQLRYIVEVVETGSISRAASNLYISQPNLSAQINSLENELGRIIFERTNKGVKLTTEGREIYHYAKTLVNQFELTEKKLLYDYNDNKIKIASFGSCIVRRKFTDLCAIFKNKNYEFILYDDNFDDAIDKLINRDVDIAFIQYSHYQEKNILKYLENENLECVELIEGELKLHVNESSLLNHREYISADDLNGLFCVKKQQLFRGLFNLNYEVKELGLDTNKKIIRVNDSKSYEDILINLPSFSVCVDWKTEYNFNGYLKRIPFKDKKIVMKCSVVKRRNELLKDELKLLIEEIKALS